jgi:hypothetical protein
VPDPAVSDAGVQSVCERLCLDARPATSIRGRWTADLGGVAVSTVSRGAVVDVDAGSVAEGSNVGSARGDSVGTEGHPEHSLVSSEPGRVASPLGSASRSTMRFTRFFRAFAPVAARNGDGWWCDEEGEKVGLLKGLARFDAVGGTAIAAVGATPTGTVDGE